MDNIRTLHIFQKVAETASFSSTAKLLNIGQPSISKTISTFEEQLGLTLFIRNTRNVTLTEAGEAIYQKSLDVTASFDSLLSIGESAKNTTKGNITLSCPSAFSYIRLIPKLKMFNTFYPHININLHAEDRATNTQNIDLAITFSKPSNKDHITTHIGELSKIVVASKHYFTRHPTPQTPTDLKQHKCITNTTTPNANKWSFQHNDTKQHITITPSFSCSDNMGVRTAILDDMGIAIIAKTLFTQAQLTDTLDIALADYSTPTTPVYITYLQGKHVPAHTQIFINYITAELGKDLAPH